MSKSKSLFSRNLDDHYTYLVTKEQPLSYATESFQKILVNLDYINLDGTKKVIEFTSTIASEGKTTFVANFSYLLAQKGKKVIVLDVDIRRPKLHRVFEDINDFGLTDYLSSKITFDQLIRHSKYENLDYILAGEKTTAVINVLESEKLKELIKKLKESYDYVLLDTPPVIAVSDALYIAKNADGVIFVVAQNTAKKNLVKEAVQTLKMNGVPIIGMVLTRVNMKSGFFGTSIDHSYEYE